MSPTQWFVIRIRYGRIEVLSKAFDEKDDAFEVYRDLSKEFDVQVVETIYG